MMKKISLFILLLFPLLTVAQQEANAEIFWNNLKQHCGKAFEGTITQAPANDDFRGKKLVMHVLSCEDNTIRIPFFVGEDRSRTWVLSLDNQRIQLKHDHRHQDGSEDEITQYGGTASNSGLANLQVFPADVFTAELLPPAASNVWWITLENDSFSYNLKRIGSDRIFTVTFDLKNSVETPEAPWGWEKK